MLLLSNSAAIELNSAAMESKKNTIKRMVGLEDLLHLAVQLETIGDLPSLLADNAQHVDVHACGTDTALLIWVLESRPLRAQPVLVLRLVSLASLVVGLVGPQREVSDILGRILSHGTLLD